MRLCGVCVLRHCNTRWFFKNYVSLNVGKWHFLYHRKDAANETYIFKHLVTKNSKGQEILGVTRYKERNLKLKSH